MFAHASLIAAALLPVGTTTPPVAETTAVSVVVFSLPSDRATLKRYFCNVKADFLVRLAYVNWIIEFC